MKGKILWIVAIIVAVYLFVPKVKDMIDKLFKWGQYKVPQGKVFESPKPSTPVQYTGTVYTGQSQQDETSSNNA